ncbi:MAG: membrane-bound serine protease (ClpP class) [Kiritimatiellia bacterium]|jgi:membrane-bound serine protease (ClpP class)
MENADILFWSLTVAGFALIAAEVVVPGGVLGVLGLLALVGASVISFQIFGTTGGILATVLLMLGSVTFLAGWLYIFPKTRIGKTLTLQLDGASWKASRIDQGLVGQEGVALSNLVPSGVAMIQDKRTDVVAESTFVDKGSPVKVIEVAGNRVVVRKTQ